MDGEHSTVTGTPLLERYFEDYQTGEVFEFGEHRVTEDEIMRFARDYDPQPFHLDHAAAAASHFGGVVGSGWMTCGIVMRLYVDHFIPPCSAMGGGGVDKLRWTLPVRPGDHLHARATVLATRVSSTKPDRGFVTLLQEGVNQRGEIVVSYEGVGIFKTRAGGVSAA